MTHDVTIVGAGVIGMVAAALAVRLGRSVHLVEGEAAASSSNALSWRGTRVVRDDSPDGSNPPNTRQWRRMLEIVGAGAILAQGVTHVHGEGDSTATLDAGTPAADGGPDELALRGAVEKDAFVVDTRAVRRCLMAFLRSFPGFQFSPGTLVDAVDDESGRVYASNGRCFESGTVVVAAGPGAGELLRPLHAPRTRVLTQVCAILKAECAYGMPGHFPAFIHHDGNRGVWGTPAINDCRAKVSASSLCFDSPEDARRFVESRKETRRFIDRARRLLPLLEENHVSHWSLGSYPSIEGDPVFKRERLRAHLACNGGGFKRAVSIAANLLSPA